MNSAGSGVVKLLAIFYFGAGGMTGELCKRFLYLTSWHGASQGRVLVWLLGNFLGAILWISLFRRRHLTSEAEPSFRFLQGWTVGIRFQLAVYLIAWLTGVGFGVFWPD